MTTIRELQIEAREKRIADLIPRMARVRVTPRDDIIRRFIAHPDGNIGFPASGSAEWPLDSFTNRRIRDGTVIVEGRPFGAAHSEAEVHAATVRHNERLAERRSIIGGRRYAVETAEHPGEIAHDIDPNQGPPEKPFLDPHNPYVEATRRRDETPRTRATAPVYRTTTRTRRPSGSAEPPRRPEPPTSAE